MPGVGKTGQMVFHEGPDFLWVIALPHPNPGKGQAHMLHHGLEEPIPLLAILPVVQKVGRS